MKTLIVLLLLTPVALFGQSPFDGTWVLNQDTAQLPNKPAEYSLNKGMFRCSGCIVNMEIEADGYDHKVAAADYWDTVNVQMVDAHTVEIIAKKAGKTMLTEVDAISPDGSTLTQMVKDTTEADTVTIETVNRRIDNGPAGSHAISGSWRACKSNRSNNGSLIKYKCTADEFSGDTPLGERFDAKFDGNYYPVEDDPGHTMVSAKLLNPNTVELTHKRNGKIVSISHMSVAPGGQSIHVVFENKDANSTTTFDFQKQP
ncbi:MAG: hypothetical protein WAN76_02245 [Candidatus Sulfotelmatobacter sp.]